MVQLNQQYGRVENPGEPIYIKVVGVGGAGSNVLDRVMLDGIEAADLVAGQFVSTRFCCIAL